MMMFLFLPDYTILAIGACACSLRRLRLVLAVQASELFYNWELHRPDRSIPWGLRVRWDAESCRMQLWDILESKGMAWHQNAMLAVRDNNFAMAGDYFININGSDDRQGMEVELHFAQSLYCLMMKGVLRETLV